MIRLQKKLCTNGPIPVVVVEAGLPPGPVRENRPELGRQRARRPFLPGAHRHLAPPRLLQARCAPSQPTSDTSTRCSSAPRTTSASTSTMQFKPPHYRFFYCYLHTVHTAQETTSQHLDQLLRVGACVVETKQERRITSIDMSFLPVHQCFN